ncbi:ABC transporter permease/M1 family aminopeptidase [Flavitalea sp.]|nr:M1 family aminopeptidase [Flavitalea sp.]
MFKQLLAFEGSFFLRRPVLYVNLIIFLIIGLLAGSNSSIGFPNINKNSPYEITYITGIFSLLLIFATTLLVAHSFQREQDSRFAAVLYALPLEKHVYLLTRVIAMVFIISFCIAMAELGLWVGHLISSLPPDKVGSYKLINYLFPLLALAVPNAIFCVSLICSTAWLTRNKLVIYITGLCIYIFYIVGSIYANSPLIAGANPASPEQMSLFAKLDPFGMAAFFEQTRYWTAVERNEQQLSLSGNFLFNRVIWCLISFLVLLFSYKRFSFITEPIKPLKKSTKVIALRPDIVYRSAGIETQTYRHNIAVFISTLKLNLRSVLKGIPLVLILILLTFILSVEIANAIAGDPRLGSNFARTGLIVSTIMETIPFYCMLVILFYSAELIWKSRLAGFHYIELSTAANPGTIVLSKLVSIMTLPLLLIANSIIAGIVFQVINGFQIIDLTIYLSLFYFTALPLLIATVLITSIQLVVNNKYAGLAIATGVVLLTSTNFGLMLGLTSPMLRIGDPFQIFYGDMNGFGGYKTAFHWKMIFHGSLAVALVLILPSIIQRRFRLASKTTKVLLSSMILIGTISGYYIFRETHINSNILKGTRLNEWKQEYELKYKQYKELPLLTVTDVKALVQLKPSQQEYHVSGRYHLINKTAGNIDSILLYMPAEITLKSIKIESPGLFKNDTSFHHYWYVLTKPISPSDTCIIQFSFSSGWSTFTGHQAFNSIIENGTFIRISRYFPSFGYHEDNEITNSIERTKRKMAPQDLLKLVEAPSMPDYDHGYINLDLTISTLEDQTAISTGILVNEWKADSQHYFRYITDKPIPFRFAVSSARYKVKKAYHKNIPIEIYFDERHNVNADKLIAGAKRTLTYFDSNFVAYPHRIIRFAEISAFADGFAATAYPTIIYMKENGGFYNNLSDSSEHDVINGLAAHELAHQWWGGTPITPEIREGGWLLTEGIANYIALMIYQQEHGKKAALEIVRQHLDTYLSSRSYSQETPIYKTTYNTPHLAYNKGLVALYQLQLLIGEKALNRALASLLIARAYPKVPPTTQDFLDELRGVTPPGMQHKVDELFKQIIIYDLKLKSVSGTKIPEGYKVTFRGEVLKFLEDGKGNKRVIAVDEKIAVTCVSDDGKEVTRYFPVSAGLINGSFVSKEKPMYIKMDPDLSLIDLFLKDNEKNVEIN